MTLHHTSAVRSPDPIPARRHRRWSVVALAVWLSLVTYPARAGKLDDLARQLSNADYKVRLAAVLAIGKLAEPGSVGPLGQALSDPHRLVRSMAAEILGRMGNASAIGGLKALLVKEQDPYVRQKAEKALATLMASARTESPESAAKNKIYLAFGSFAGGSRNADATQLELLRTALRKELSRLPTLTFTLEPGVDEKSFAKSGRVGFLIDGQISRLSESMVGGTHETDCDVKVQVLRWPSKSLILWTNAGAAVQGGSGPREKDSSRRQCLEATAGQLAEDLLKFLQSQGR